MKVLYYLSGPGLSDYDHKWIGYKGFNGIFYSETNFFLWS